MFQDQQQFKQAVERAKHAQLDLEGHLSTLMAKPGTISRNDNEVYFTARRGFGVQCTVYFVFSHKGEPNIAFNWPSGGSRAQAIQDCIQFADRFAGFCTD
jgi:hypothetical protein